MTKLEERIIAEAIYVLAEGNALDEKQIEQLEYELAMLKLSDSNLYRVLSKAFQSKKEMKVA